MSYLTRLALIKTKLCPHNSSNRVRHFENDEHVKIRVHCIAGTDNSPWCAGARRRFVVDAMIVGDENILCENHHYLEVKWWRFPFRANEFVSDPSKMRRGPTRTDRRTL